MKLLRRPLATAFLALATGLTGLTAPAQAQDTLLNVSYDVARELYKDLNPAFAKNWQAKTGRSVAVNQSHGGSSKQALAVAGGLEADVVTMNQATDVDMLASQGIVASDWRKRFAHGAAPYTSVTVFLVRKGNPKAVKDWADLTRPGLQVIVPNPKVTGNGRYTYLAAWGSVIAAGGTEAQARERVSKLFANVPVLDGGGRGATTTFTQRGIGDVLVTFENEAELIENEFGKGLFDVVYPSVTIEAEMPVALNEKVTAKRGSQALAKAYLDFLYSPEAQEIIARHNLRPRLPDVAKKHAARFPDLKTFTVDALLGGWAQVAKTHFADGGVYDQIQAGIKR
ncbi:sulfate ABC transporter substrate-binding protein [Inhella gelatinilytica]|uniref:Sulfate ABC transporter substrate-binding protein n=1 Tax=Inhella gelatinilytica TaxID=2795030 RepID=A0A931IW11_9BURK|nr:sulfate ABC transporter substrate-binding protein [Inhella gelatinilytica]MBH9551668.1 sulfate ABC transporter substrate-binding protein [Inhella gelatinilytica]